MSEIIKESKTVENAIELALEELECQREDVKIEVIQEPVKGIFGLSKMAKVKVTTLKDANETFINKDISPEIQTVAKEGLDSLNKMLSFMAMQEITIKTSIENDTIIFDVLTESEGLLIGRHGQTLSSLQYLMNRIINHKTNNKIKCVIDIGGYRTKHKIILEKMAKRIAKKVSETKQEEQLKAMNAFDRRIIHLSIKDNPEVTTYSLGEGNFRRVVIAPKEKASNI